MFLQRSLFVSAAVPVQVPDDERVARARSRIATAREVARRGRYASAERMLREALGVLERRQRFAGAARAAATLGELLRERGQGERAGAVMRQARLLFEAVEIEDMPAGNLGAKAAARSDHEDYVEARILLSGSAMSGRDAKPKDEGGDETGVADDCVALLEKTGATDGVEALDRICGWLWRRLAARSVAVYGFGDRITCFASAGDVEPRVHASIHTLAESSDRRQRQDRGDVGHRVVEPVAIDGQAVGALSVRWARASGTSRYPRTSGLTRVVSTLCGWYLPGLVQGGRDLDRVPEYGGLIGGSQEMREVYESVARASAASYPVLIEGETGVGKELVAKAIHRAGPRQKQVFCPVNCAALSDELFEAELFGHARGAFTGAVGDRIGLVESANRGTLFLDEVGELSSRAQAKLLRVIQEGELRRVGENTVRRVDIQLIAATNRDLAKEVTAGRFRQDLLFRLAVMCLRVPSLRERVGDVELLTRHFWAKAMARAGKRATLPPSLLQLLTRYGWPGNVRELQNVIARLAVFAPRRGAVCPSTLPLSIREQAQPRPVTLAEARRRFEQRFVTAALHRSGGRPTVTARELGISRQGLAKLLARLAIETPEMRGPVG